MRRLVSITLSILVLWQIIGCVAFFEISHLLVKSESKNELKSTKSEKQLITRIYSFEQVKEFVWIKKDEFKFNGIFYDVKEQTVLENGQIKFLLKLDKKESNLLRQYLKISSGKGHLDSDFAVIWIKVFAYPLITHDNCAIAYSSNLVLQSSKNYVKHIYFETHGYVRELFSPPRA